MSRCESASKRPDASHPADDGPRQLCKKSKDGKHEDDGGMFFASCKHCGLMLDDSYTDAYEGGGR